MCLAPTSPAVRQGSHAVTRRRTSAAHTREISAAIPRHNFAAHPDKHLVALREKTSAASRGNYVAIQQMAFVAQVTASAAAGAAARNNAAAPLAQTLRLIPRTVVSAATSVPLGPLTQPLPVSMERVDGHVTLPILSVEMRVVHLGTVVVTTSVHR